MRSITLHAADYNAQLVKAQRIKHVHVYIHVASYVYTCSYNHVQLNLAT